MSRFEGIYLDHNATTPVKPGVRDIMLEMLDFPGNASAVHKAGREARRRIEQARKSVSRLVQAGPRDVVVFTSGATEANNMVLRGAGMERVIVSAIEHPSVLQAAPGGDILPVRPEGIIDLAALDALLAGNTRQTLISVMTVNNETGVIQPVEEVVALARKHGALVHTDAVQAPGRVPLDITASGVDFMTLSAHKMGGPQGAGCLVVANCAVVEPLLRGGGQEKNLRAGTENLAAVAGFGVAADLVSMDDAAKHRVWRDRIETELSARAPGLRVFGSDAPRVANTSMFSLPGAESETQLIALDLAGVCVSNGSACSSGTVQPSHVLQAMGADKAEAASSLRVSLGWDTTEEDVTGFIEKWSDMHDRIKSRLGAA